MAHADFAPLIRPLLGALRWKGDERGVQEALPAHAHELDLSGFRDTLVHLGFTSTLHKSIGRQNIALPAIGMDKDGQPHVLKSVDELKQGFSSYITFAPATMPMTPDNGDVKIAKEARRFKPLLNQILLISLAIGVIALAPILFNRMLYDHVIAAGSTRSLPMLVTGVALAFAVELYLRHMRNRYLSHFGARTDHVVSCSVFERLLFLPPAYTERAAVSAQIARLRDFENVREFFTGPLATLFFELPLIGVYLAVMAVLSGWLTLVPIGLLGAYAILLFAMDGKLKENSRNSASNASQRQEFLLETVTKLPAIRMAGMERSWQNRYRVLSGNASQSSFHSAYTAQILETLSYVLMSLGGIATLGFGVNAVIQGNISMGALIAAMMLIWRIVAPMQICCASITRIQQLKSSTQQVKRLLSVMPEHNPYAPPILIKPKGRVTFHRVSLRYTPEADPVLLGVSIDVKPGQIIAIRGANGSGKSTILKLVLGLYRPQNGSVRIDGVDIRQFDPVVLRQAISYVPQNVHIFPGTIRENLLFSAPDATDAQCIEALQQACALEEALSLPQQLDTIIEGANAASVSFMFLQRLNLARAYLRDAPIVLFDEASHSLGKDNDIAFAEKINSLRGKSTVLLVTHREDHMLLADQLLVMNKGELTHAGPPEQVLTVLRGKK